MKYLCRAGEGVVWSLAILMESNITEFNHGMIVWKFRRNSFEKHCATQQEICLFLLCLLSSAVWAAIVLFYGEETH